MPTGRQSKSAETKPKRKPGRPTKLTKVMARKICILIAEGMSLREIASVKGMPDRSTVLRWASKHIEFRDQYARARERQAELMAEEIISIADDGRYDWTKSRGGDDGGWQLNTEYIQRSKLRVEARKWVASKLLPKKYGSCRDIDINHPTGVVVVPNGVSAEDWIQQQRELNPSQEPQSGIR